MSWPAEFERTTCRGCQASTLTFIFSVGDHYVSDFVASGGGRTVPLDVMLCDSEQGGCGLLQLRHTVPPELLYQRYWYRSGMNRTMTRALEDITRTAERLVELKTGDIVLDVGCNDGTLLRSYATEGLRLVGFEPAGNLLHDAQVGTEVIFSAFFQSGPFSERFGGAKAKIITSIAMMYDLDDPNAFIADLARCLDPDGVWLIQMSYLPTMLSNNIVDNICHEHLTYFSLSTLRPLLSRHGLKVVDVELNDVNAGSFRINVKHERCGTTPLQDRRIALLERSERNLGLGRRGIYLEFVSRVMEVRQQLCSLIRDEVAQGKTIYVYGASTKGNTLLQFCGLDHRLITAAADRNPEKWGKKTIGTMIPIISEEQARAEQPDYFLVLPWHFLEEFLQRERGYLDAGGRFIIPLPRPKIVSQRETTFLSEVLR